MAGYGYTYDGDNWSKPSYDSDHVCKPVIIDAEGRKHPIVSYTPQACITETQTVVQQVHTPFMNDYKHSSPTRYEIEPLKDHGYGEDKWRDPSSPVRGVHHHDHDRPQKVEEFITKVQTEVSRPNRFSPLNASHWRQTPNSTGYHVDYNDNKQWHKPGSNTIRDESYDDYYRNKGNGTQPTMINNGGWPRPSRAGWASPPDTSLSRPTNDIDTAVEFLKEAIKPTSFTSPHSRVTVPISTGPKRDDYAETFDSRDTARRYGNGNFNSSSHPHPVDTYASSIDSREAAKRYGNFNSSSHPHPVDTYASSIDSREAAKRYGDFNSSSQPVDRYTPTIDSREALRKYGGRAI